MNGVTVLGLLWFSFLGALGAVMLVLLLAFLLRRHFVNYMADGALQRLLKDPYNENLWEMVVGMTRMPPHILMETELRAATKSSLERPLGTVTRSIDLGKVALSPAQLIRPPLGPEAPVDLSVVLGPRAAIPLRLPTPIMVSALGFGVAMSEPFCLAMAKGAAKAGAAYNAGSGPILDGVLEDSKILVLQYTGGAWNRERETLAEADMIEVRYGHGGRASAGHVIDVARLPKKASELMGIKDGAQKVLMEAPIPGAATPEELKRLVPELKQLIGGRPVAVKLALTHDLEQELAAVLEAGVDVIALDGKAGGTHGAPPAIADEMGLPLVHGLVRAVRFLEQTGARKQVSLIAGGGLRTPGEMLKALALGADAVYTGTAVMMAAAHGQLTRATPFEPITSLVWADGRKADSFDAAKGAENVANFLLSCTDELREALRALGRRSLAELSRQELIALDREAAETLDLAPGWKAPAQVAQASKVGAPAGGMGAGAGRAQPGQQPWQPPAAAAGPQPWQPPAGTGHQPWSPPAQPQQTQAQPQQTVAEPAQGQAGQAQPGQVGSGLRIRRVRYPSDPPGDQSGGGSTVPSWFPPGPAPGASQGQPGAQPGQQGAQPGRVRRTRQT